MQKHRLQRFLSAMAVGAVIAIAPVFSTAEEDSAELPQPTQRSPEQTTSTNAPTPQSKKPATLKRQEKNQRGDDVFKPSEQISEDFAAPLPVDI